jgi:demethylmenaquinone methyltransferase/2-methoxy-6-polyprenyl-1,4-benzoquinol methylase
MDNLAAYYARRAGEYERIYAKPEWQADLALLRARIAQLFSGRKVLELACGTGYWTCVIAPHAKHVTGIDATEETLEIARSKHYSPGKVEFVRGDAYALPDFDRRHDALFAGFWWSHVPLQRLDGFLRASERAIAPGGLLVFLDNAYVEGSSTPISRRDAEGNTYQTRRLDDGSTHEVLKNFAVDDELRERAGTHGHSVAIERFEYYWLLAYRTKVDHG